MNIQDFDLSTIYTREDGSYVINHGLYHVPNEGEWTDLWAEVNAYAKEHPKVVQAEPVYEPTEKELLEQELSSLQGYLSSTDWYAIRQADSGEPMPEDVKQKRAEARVRISEIRERIADMGSDA